MKKKVSVFLIIAMLIVLYACGTDDITDQIANVAQAEDEHVFTGDEMDDGDVDHTDDGNANNSNNDAVDNTDDDIDENALLEEFITLICSYSDPPDLEGDALQEYFKREFDSWVAGESYTNITTDAYGHLTIPDHTAEYTGMWWDTYSQQCNMEISSSDGIYYNIDINWGDSASENTHWSLGGTYDEETGGIHYYGSRIEEYYPDEGDVQETYVYSDGEGFIWIGDDGMLYWDDYTEQQGADCAFHRSE